jgi:type IV pilus assembly protein PilE
MNTQKGFTLLELVIVVVIVAILAAVAIPNYQTYTIKTRRAAAAGCLLEISQLMERHHTVNMSYTGFALPNPPMRCIGDLAGHYNFAVTNLAARAYTLNAAPQGAQSTKDPASCGTLAIDQAGQKGAGGDVSKCWK